MCRSVDGGGGGQDTAPYLADVSREGRSQLRMVVDTAILKVRMGSSVPQRYLVRGVHMPSSNVASAQRIHHGILSGSCLCCCQPLSFQVSLNSERLTILHFSFMGHLSPHHLDPPRSTTTLQPPRSNHHTQPPRSNHHAPTTTLRPQPGNAGASRYWSPPPPVYLPHSGSRPAGSQGLSRSSRTVL